ncbi:MAG: type II toxin-antitoxin system VapC family toxin [Planctomycetaceae bacterium]|jgi:tRNA(fMet)-specific endonuclease VapC|nr:type II toxin-antitoxin system VapC family toxin [Planctomycetaceae bacterium]
MAVVISPDTSVLIEHFRTKDKEYTSYRKLVRDGYQFAISAITQYEVIAGTRGELLEIWLSELETMFFLPITKPVVMKAREINLQLKRDRKQLDMPDILIAATAMVNNLSLATLNTKHFERIKGLGLVPMK